MNKEEIKEYLEKVDLLRVTINEEDKDTLEWLIFGYNQCAKLLYEKEKQLEDIRNYIKQSDLDKMLWGKELMKIIEREEK